MFSLFFFVVVGGSGKVRLNKEGIEGDEVWSTDPGHGGASRIVNRKLDVWMLELLLDGSFGVAAGRKAFHIHFWG